MLEAELKNELELGLQPERGIDPLGADLAASPELTAGHGMESPRPSWEDAEPMGLVADGALISDRISAYTRRTIEQEACRAVREGVSRRDACSYPFNSPEGEHFTAVFLLAGGKLD